MTCPNNKITSLEEKLQEIREMYLYGQLTGLEEYLDMCIRAEQEYSFTKKIQEGLDVLENADKHLQELAF